jgi:hypothetical protein
MLKTSQTPTKLPKSSNNNNNKKFNSDHNQVKQNVQQSREKYRQYANNYNHTKEANFKVNDLVLFKRRTRLKPDTYYEKEPYKIIKIKGNQITINNNLSTRIVNSSELKLFKNFDQNLQQNQANSKISNNSNQNQNSSNIQIKSLYNFRSRKSSNLNEINNDLNDEIFIPENNLW